MVQIFAQQSPAKTGCKRKRTDSDLDGRVQERKPTAFNEEERQVLLYLPERLPTTKEEFAVAAKKLTENKELMALIKKTPPEVLQRMTCHNLEIHDGMEPETLFWEVFWWKYHQIDACLGVTTRGQWIIPQQEVDGIPSGLDDDCEYPAIDRELPRQQAGPGADEGFYPNVHLNGTGCCQWVTKEIIQLWHSKQIRVLLPTDIEDVIAYDFETCFLGLFAVWSWDSYMEQSLMDDEACDASEAENIKMVERISQWINERDGKPTFAETCALSPLFKKTFKKAFERRVPKHGFNEHDIKVHSVHGHHGGSLEVWLQAPVLTYSIAKKKADAVSEMLYSTVSKNLISLICEYAFYVGSY